MITLKHLLAIVFCAAATAGCETVETAPQPVQEDASATTANKAIVGDARLAAFNAPDNCERISQGTQRMGGSTRARSGCVIKTGDSMVVVGLTEMTIPFEEAFSITGGGTGDFQQAAAAFPREMLGEYVVKVEKTALSSAEPGWRSSNKSTVLLSGNGGVEGASACLRFSFDGAGATPNSEKSKVSGLRCARFGKSTETVQEVMIEVIAFYSAGQEIPESYRRIVDQATSSLRYR